MLTLQFKTPLEIKDELKPNVDIVYFGSQNDPFVLFEGNVDFRWVEYDSNGNQTGSETCYTGDLTDEYLGQRLELDDGSGYEILEWCVNGLIGEELSFIMLSEDYYDQFEKSNQ